MYNNYLRIKSLKLAVILFDSTFLSLFHNAFCQKYIISEAVLMSEEGHFSLLEVGVNFFRNLLFCIFPLNNVIKFFGLLTFYYLC